ncbi:MAG: molybdopterin-dependent oxidoreductase, partial [Candidatus Adiutricales bacterium]
MDVTLSIDGQNISCPAGSNILEAAELNGIKIPRLCHHPDLKPYGACRLCLVEDVKSGRIMASCVTPAGQDMAVMTESPRVIKHRKNIVRLMIAEHPESCIVCSKGNRCRLRLAAAELGVGETELYPMPNYKGLEQANPFIIRDLSKCILCGKCIRADHELVVVGAIDYNMRGFESRPTTLNELALEHSTCTFCGTCVSMCPTGALSVKNTFYVGTPEEESLSVCGFCGIGCSLMLGTAYGRVMEVNPSEDRDSVNGATLCVRGHFAHDFLNSDQRLTVPQIRKEDELVEASWDEALELAAVRLTAIAKENGPQSVAFLGSSKCTNEENYLFQKIARTILKTNNVDNGSYISGRTSLQVLEERTGGGYRQRPLAGLEEAEAVLILGANPHDSMPVASYYLKRASRLGIPLVVVDPRRTDLVDFSSAWLSPFPGTDAALINGLALALINKNAYDAAAIVQFT